MWLGARGGGVGVEVTAGVWDLLGGAGEAEGLSNATTSPVFGFLISRAAFFFFEGILKSFDFGAGLFA